MSDWIPATLCVDRIDGGPAGHKTAVQTGEDWLSDRRVTSIAAHSGHDIVLFSNNAVADHEMQHLDNSQDSSVVLLTDVRLEDSPIPIGRVTAHPFWRAAE